MSMSPAQASAFEIASGYSATDSAALWRVLVATLALLGGAAARGLRAGSSRGASALPDPRRTTHAPRPVRFAMQAVLQPFPCACWSPTDHGARPVLLRPTMESPSRGAGSGLVKTG